MIDGKKGSTPEHFSPIMARLTINTDHWPDTVRGFGRRFHRVAGKIESMAAAARRAGKRWFRGLQAGREAFATT